MKISCYLLVLTFGTVILVLECLELNALGLVVFVYFLLFLFCLLLLGRNRFERVVDLIDQLKLHIVRETLGLVQKSS